MKLPQVIELAKKRWLIGALREEGWHKTRTAARMQISRPTLNVWIKRYNLNKPIDRRKVGSP